MNYFKRLYEYNFAKLNDWGGRLERNIAWGQLNKDNYASDAIWFFGCSHVHGCGVHPKKVSSYLLEQQTGIKVANFGFCGAGPMTIEEELNKLFEKGLKTKGIIIAWPSSLRWQHYNKLSQKVLWTPACLDTSIKHHNNHSGCKKLYPDEYQIYFDLVTTNKIVDVNREVIIRVNKKIKHINNIQFTFNHSEELDIKMLTPGLDKGWDNSHPGPKTHQKVADVLTEIIKEWK